MSRTWLGMCHRPAKIDDSNARLRGMNFVQDVLRKGFDFLGADDNREAEGRGIAFCI